MKADQRVAALRQFDRFYTDTVGALRSGLLDTPYNLTEARILYELAQRGTTAVGDLRRDLDVDAGYLSRILRRFTADGLAVIEASDADGRRRVVSLTANVNGITLGEAAKQLNTAVAQAGTPPRGVSVTL